MGPEEETVTPGPVMPSVAPAVVLPVGPEVVEPRRHRVYIGRDIELVKYGATAGCLGCAAAVKRR